MFTAAVPSEQAYLTNDVWIEEKGGRGGTRTQVKGRSGNQNGLTIRQAAQILRRFDLS